MVTLEEQYYDKGYFVTTLPKHIHAMLWNEIYSTNWVGDDSENIYKQIPDWYENKTPYTVNSTGSNRPVYERKVGKDVFENTPQSLKDIANETAKIADLDFFNRYYEQAELKYIDMWNGSEEIPYHFDTINGTDMLLLIYLTEQDFWIPEWGGQISVKKQVGDNIIHEEEFNPDNGRMLVINNANPLIKHRVRALKNNNVNRYTFSFIYNWK